MIVSTEVEIQNGENVSGMLFGKYSGRRSLSLKVALLINLLFLFSSVFLQADLKDCILLLSIIDTVFFVLYFAGTDDSAVYLLSKQSITIQSKQKALQRNVKWEDVRGYYLVNALVREYISWKKLDYYCLVVAQSECQHKRNSVDGIMMEEQLDKWVKDPCCVILPHTEKTEQYIHDQMCEIKRMEDWGQKSLCNKDADGMES